MPSRSAVVIETHLVLGLPGVLRHDERPPPGAAVAQVVVAGEAAQPVEARVGDGAAEAAVGVVASERAAMSLNGQGLTLV